MAIKATQGVTTGTNEHRFDFCTVAHHHHLKELQFNYYDRLGHARDDIRRAAHFANEEVQHMKTNNTITIVN